MASVASTKLAIAAVLVAGMVALWAGEINLLKDVATWDGCMSVTRPPLPPPPSPFLPTVDRPACPWKHTLFIGIALKMVFVVMLPLALFVRCRQHAKSGSQVPLVSRRFFLLSAWLSLVLLGASVTWIASIPLTLGSFNTALYQLYTPFTYLLSIPLLREALSVSKILGVLLAMLSVVLIIWSNDASDDADRQNLLTGDVLVIASAFLYALKGVLYKLWFGSEDAPSRAAAVDGVQPREASMQSTSVAVQSQVCDAAIAVGLMGLWACLFGPLVLAIAGVSGIEPFSFPPTTMLLGYLLVATMMASYMILYFGALALSSPTFVATCSLLVTPVTLIWDVAAGRTASISYLAFVGMALLVLSLSLVLFASDLDALMHNGQRARRGCCRLEQSLLRELSSSSSTEPAHLSRS